MFGDLIAAAWPTQPQLDPLVETEPVRAPARWSAVQGTLFVIGLCALVLAGGSGYYVWSYRQQFDTTKPNAADFKFTKDMMTISLSDSWDLWKRYSQLNITQRPTPYHVLARAKVAKLDLMLRVWGIVGTLGAIALLASFVIRPRSRTSAR